MKFIEKASFKHANKEDCKMIFDFTNKKKLVFKIGSALLVEDDKLRQKWIKSFAKNVAELVEKNFEIAIVSSGAVALGKSFVKDKKSRISLEEKQAAAAIGQIQLMSFFRDCFKKLNLNVAQILLTASDCNDRDRYLNAKNTIDTLIKNRIIPIINENDTIAVDGIKIGDNDRLAARIAQMISADVMILFSDIDGLHNKNPKTHENAKLIPKVSAITKEIENMAGGAVSGVGTGGMATKILAAKMLTYAGCDTVITNGVSNNSLKKFVEGKQDFTVFLSNKKTNKSRKNWLSGFLNTEGRLVVNAPAKEVLLNKKISLLPIGVVDVKGDFLAGDAIFICDEEGAHIASGITNYASLDVKRILGKKSDEVKKILGKEAKKELVHIDNMVLV
jgi:glutamate 5-kinase